jgi:hypothetical protein
MELLSLKMAECIENILWTTTECTLPKRKPKFVFFIVCTLLYLTCMSDTDMYEWY